MKNSNKKYEAIITSRVSLGGDIKLEDFKIELPPIHIELKPLDLAPLPPIHTELKPLELKPQEMITAENFEKAIKNKMNTYYTKELSRSVRAGIAKKKALDNSTLPVKKSKVQ